ncbi:MAG: hypothetical protein M3461_20055 [Pseudomonadota bacterium]|nr:hypothetical protein [Pseudomonadota bacterium]
MIATAPIVAGVILAGAFIHVPAGAPPDDPELRVNRVDANYSTSKIFVDEWPALRCR